LAPGHGKQLFVGGELHRDVRHSGGDRAIIASRDQTGLLDGIIIGVIASARIVGGRKGAPRKK
jgi:hypothetical protein